VGVDQAHYPGHAGEATIHNPFKDLREGLEMNNKVEGGERIIAWLARLVQHNALCFFQRGGLETVGLTGAEKVEDVVRSHFVDANPQSELGVLSGPGAYEGDEQAKAQSICDASSARRLLNVRSMVWASLTALLGQKGSNRAALSSSGVEPRGSSGKWGGGRPMANLFAVQTVWGAAVDWKSHQ